MVRSVHARLLFFCGLGAVFGVAAIALAAGDDRPTAEALVKEVESSTRKDAADALTARARGALERAAKLRAAGDETHAKLAEGVARSWAEAARDVSRAAAVEDSARATRLAATDAGVVADRERALLEESVAESGRLRAQLEAIEHESKDEPPRTSTSAASDSGSRPSKTTPQKAAPAPARGTVDGGAR